MAYNNVKEIKNLLLLESENQTLEDDQITTFLDDAQQELFNQIGRNRETDKFYLHEVDLNDSDEVEFVTYFVIDSIEEVRDATNNETIDSSHYEISRSGNAIKIRTGSNDADISPSVLIEVDYIPKNYKMAERAIAMETILSRLQPFHSEQVNPNFMTWREKRKNYIKMINSHFGTGSYW